MNDQSKIATGTAPGDVYFDVWGCRGSRNLVGNRSRVGSYTSCYSVLYGEDLYTFDAGEGLAMLGQAMSREARFKGVKRLHLLVTHAHVDHWEGLKDVDWFWTRGNGLEVTIYAAKEAIDTIHLGFQPPSYVPLEVLSLGTVDKLSWTALCVGQDVNVGPARLRVFAMHHYSGIGDQRRHLDALGYLLTIPGGPTVAYLSDHEPVEGTAETEDAMLATAHIALFDAHFPDIKSHAFGHGSQEYTAGAARRHPNTLVLAGHHGPGFSDEAVRAAEAKFGAGVANYRIAVEGNSYRWDAGERRFSLTADDAK